MNVTDKLGTALRGLLEYYEGGGGKTVEQAARAALLAWESQDAESEEYPEGTHVWTVENRDFREIPGGLQAVTFTPKVGFWPERDNRKDGAFFWVRLSRDGTELCLPSESVTTTQPGENPCL